MTMHSFCRLPLNGVMILSSYQNTQPITKTILVANSSISARLASVWPYPFPNFTPLPPVTISSSPSS
ncbi:hypothetical protein BASA81_013794 [Batrachochytrium salamandrivorans]|nr:hypothetical protein BASA81_013794 [Batrachochytrium salamandrivorans]